MDDADYSGHEEIDDYGDDDDHEYESFADDQGFRLSRTRDSKTKKDFKQVDDIHRRIWLDPKTPLVGRVNRFLEQELGTLHPLDLTLSSVDLIRECGKQKSFEGMKYAHDILDRVLEEKRRVNVPGEKPKIVIPERVFKTLMFGWAKNSNLSNDAKMAPQKMREILNTMLEEVEKDNEYRTKEGDASESRSSSSSEGKINYSIFESVSSEPTVDIFNTLLQGLVEASHRSMAAAGEAQDLLMKMDKLNQVHGWHTKPNQRSFTFVMDAFAKTKHPTAGTRAEAVLRSMIKYHEREKASYLEEYGVEYNLSDPSANKRRIVTADAMAYTAAINAHTQSESPGSAQCALNLLLEVIQSTDPSLKVDAYVFSSAIQAFSRLAAKKKSPRGRVASAERAEEILWLMVDELKRQHEAVANEEMAEVTIEPSVVPFNACLNAWARSESDEGGPASEELLRKMLDPDLQEVTGVMPDTISFNSCLQAWSRSARTNSEAAEKAEELLNFMLELELDTARPDSHSYTTVS